MSDPAWTTEAPSVAGLYEHRWVRSLTRGDKVYLFTGMLEWHPDDPWPLSPVVSEWRGPLPRPGGTG